ncbi:hypothetical protein [Micromonospora wenchangensis]|uniref:Uncharacterized protein n=1 Tax=Micromonospora wenchangensis TaxID=1185415 RepID=A0A246REG5_9ACTN|nr:hypothetical protein [Micromonospora wenchangensis]OWV00258.1 hypothetical protein B5D80_28245 [Micromonospora wenchangensis]
MTEGGEVRPAWLIWPAGMAAILAWALGRLTGAAIFDLLAVAAGAWAGGYLLTAAACAHLARTGRLPSGDDPEQG